MPLPDYPAAQHQLRATLHHSQHCPNPFTVLNHPTPPHSPFFFLNDPAPPEIYPLPLPAPLPIYPADNAERPVEPTTCGNRIEMRARPDLRQLRAPPPQAAEQVPRRVRHNFESRLAHPPRSEEHTSELQSPCNLVCRLLLEKKKTY